jgi:hypothetical protein
MLGCLATTNQLDKPAFFMCSNTRFSYNYGKQPAGFNQIVPKWEISGQVGSYWDGVMWNFINADRETDYLFPPSMQDWVSKDHLPRFAVDVVDQLDLTLQYAGRDSQTYHPVLLRGLLIYGYATGVFSILKIEWASRASIPFRYLANNTSPDNDRIAMSRLGAEDDFGLLVAFPEAVKC